MESTTLTEQMAAWSNGDHSFSGFVTTVAVGQIPEYRCCVQMPETGDTRVHQCKLDPGHEGLHENFLEQMF